MQTLFKSFCFLAGLATVAGTVLLASSSGSLAHLPKTSWWIRNTGLGSQNSCLNVANDALAHESLENIRDSGKSGVKGEIGPNIAYIICQQNGSKAYIFCAGNDAKSLCVDLKRYIAE